MWQFMKATGAAYGLEVTDYVDERMDPIKSTRAAARHLKDLHQRWRGNWHIALSGYNCSPTCINRAIRRAGGTTKKSTFLLGYIGVPAKRNQRLYPTIYCLCVDHVQPGSFWIAGKSDGPEFAYDVVPITGMLSLDTIAEMAGTTKKVIQDLNPELRNNMLPPSTEPYPLRIPLNTFPRFADAFERLPKDKKRMPRTHVVKRRESLGKISRRYGTTVATLKSTNGLRSTVIHPGQHLVVPAASREIAQLSGQGVSSKQWGPRITRPIEFDPAVAETAKRTLNSTPRASSPKSSTPVRQASNRTSSGNTITYRVRRRDTLSKLARKYSTSVRAIQNLNGLRNSRIRVGQLLKISQGTKIHIVRRGDNLTKIAKRYGTTIRKIKRNNNLRSSRIHPGQRLKIL